MRGAGVGLGRRGGLPLQRIEPASGNRVGAAPRARPHAQTKRPLHLSCPSVFIRGPIRLTYFVVWGRAQAGKPVPPGRRWRGYLPRSFAVTGRGGPSTVVMHRRGRRDRGGAAETQLFHSGFRPRGKTLTRGETPRLQFHRCPLGFICGPILSAFIRVYLRFQHAGSGGPAHSCHGAPRPGPQGCFTGKAAGREGVSRPRAPPPPLRGRGRRGRVGGKARRGALRSGRGPGLRSA